MLEWLAENMWVGWLAIAVLLLVVETMALDLIYLMLGGGAAAAMIAALIGGPLWVQVGSGAAVALILLFAVRPVALKHLRQSREPQDFGIQALPGREATVVEPITDATGQVRVEGEIWSARTTDPELVSPDETVVIDRVDGAVLWVNTRPFLGHHSPDYETGRS